jgi:DNA-binding NtrC family response regulator
MNRIMVLDDDEQIRKALLKILRVEGYEVILAGQAGEALDKLERQSIDLLLLDLNLPNKSGWDVFERVTSINPLLPVIIITGKEKQSELAVAAGVGALMQKPLDVPLLLKTIAELLIESPEQRLKRLVGADQSTRCFEPAATASTAANSRKGKRAKVAPHL